MSASRPRIASLLIAAPVAALLVGVLAACAAEPAPTGSPSPEPTASESATPEPTEEPGTGTAIDLACDELVDPETMYAFNPNFGLVADWSPDAGTAAADALAADGIACRWVNQSGGEVLDVSVASLDPARLTDLKNRAFAESQMVPTYGEEAYFEVEDGIGTAIVFQGPYWLVATSSYFLEPGEATEIVNAALGALP